MASFFKEAVAEFKKVEWPSKKETIRLTGTLIGVSLSVGLFVLALDYIFKQSLSLLIK
ncbi:MAG: preprotein translocase subunit SecE [Patescibacteria group bacterium]|jgi:preprotein translocase SecE subunit